MHQKSDVPSYLTCSEVDSIALVLPAAIGLSAVRLATPVVADPAQPASAAAVSDVACSHTDRSN
jgi:hypothetical protein